MKEWSARRLRAVADAYLRRILDSDDVPHVNELAVSLDMSSPDFSNLFFERVRVHPSEYLKRQQIDCAKGLLAETGLPINQIAYKCGFRTRRSFFRAFKRMAGTTPARYRTDHRRYPK